MLPVDHVYVLNLDRRQDKWERMQVQLKKLGITAERFSAVDGAADGGSGNSGGTVTLRLSHVNSIVTSGGAGAYPGSDGGAGSGAGGNGGLSGNVDAKKSIINNYIDLTGGAASLAGTSGGTGGTCFLDLCDVNGAVTVTGGAANSGIAGTVGLLYSNLCRIQALTQPSDTPSVHRGTVMAGTFIATQN